MKPRKLSELPASSIRAVFSDLDGTITTNGTLLPSTYQSLCAIRAAGLKLVIVSGRPAGWADCLMRLLPLDAMIFENGAGLALRSGDTIEFLNLAGTSAAEPGALHQVFEALRREYPELRLAKDQPYRLFDYAIDICEEPPHLSSDVVEDILKRLDQTPGVTAKLSNIHINFWMGEYTKRAACEFLLANNFLGGLTQDEVVFVGDSPNDEPLFGFFAHSVGTDNVQVYFDRMKDLPKFICSRHEGFGFEEVSELLVKARTKS
ncbi:MAG: HAD family phosphatase [Bdellovibrionales bacterium]|nr:HAD family phosphatase [Bdellovibrionales bacterium]